MHVHHLSNWFSNSFLRRWYPIRTWHLRLLAISSLTMHSCMPSNNLFITAACNDDYELRGDIFRYHSSVLTLTSFSASHRRSRSHAGDIFRQQCNILQYFWQDCSSNSSSVKRSHNFFHTTTTLNFNRQLQYHLSNNTPSWISSGRCMLFSPLLLLLRPWVLMLRRECASRIRSQSNTVVVIAFLLNALTPVRCEMIYSDLSFYSTCFE